MTIAEHLGDLPHGQRHARVLSAATRIVSILGIRMVRGMSACCVTRAPDKTALLMPG